MMRALTVLLAASVACTAVTAQQASFTTFGTACSQGKSTPGIGNNGLPRLGTSFDITYSGPNVLFNSSQQRTQPILFLGLSATATPIPTLFPQQPANCLLYTSPVIVLTTPPDPGGQPVYGDAVTVPIANDPTLLGASLFAQWFAIFEQCGFAGCDVQWALGSQAAHIVVGT